MLLLHAWFSVTLLLTKNVQIHVNEYSISLSWAISSGVCWELLKPADRLNVLGHDLNKNMKIFNNSIITVSFLQNVFALIHNFTNTLFSYSYYMCIMFTVAMNFKAILTHLGRTTC